MTILKRTGQALKRFAPRRLAPGRLARFAATAACCAAIVAAATTARAKVDLVTIPARDTIQLTIYNSEDLTLVRESRLLTFREGINPIQFSWANTLIDPTSLQLIFKERPADFEVLDITYPANTQNVLIWNVRAKKGGPAPIEILYFTSGITWEADYVAKASAAEDRMGLEGYVRVTNNSGEDFENAQVRLVVGTVNLVEKIADLARRGIIPQEDLDVARRQMAKEVMADMAMPAAAPRMAMGYAVAESAAIKEVVKQAVSEYQLYTIEGTEDIPNGWSKRLRSFTADDVKIQVAYEYHEGKYGPFVVKFYKTKNDAEHKLGKDPLPDGTYRVLREDGAGGLAWEGQHADRYVPVGEKLEINLGTDGLVTIEPRLMKLQRAKIDFDKYNNVIGWDAIETRQIEIRNSKPVAVPIKITLAFGGEWDIDPKIDAKKDKFQKKDQSTVEFEIVVAPLATRTLDYTLTTHFGSNAERK